MRFNPAMNNNDPMANNNDPIVNNNNPVVNNNNPTVNNNNPSGEENPLLRALISKLSELTEQGKVITYGPYYYPYTIVLKANKY